MIRSTALASLAALALAAGAAQAQAPRDGSAAALEGNAVGGGAIGMTGAGDDAAFERIAEGPAQPARAARLDGGAGGGPEVVYLAPVPAGERGRMALLLGSGEEARVIYLDSPTGSHTAAAPDPAAGG